MRTAIVATPLQPLASAPGDGDAGAEIVFHGRVRGSEGDREITALYYEHYEGMAEAELERLASEAVERFSLFDLSCTHRIGEVPVGEASLRAVVRAAHRTEALAALEWFIAELKTRVPIWKWGVLATGDRFPSGGPVR